MVEMVDNIMLIISRSTLLILLCVVMAVSAQYSYVPSRLFASYQFTVTNYNNPNTSLTSSSISNPYTVNFQDIHNNINHHAIVLAGLSNNGEVDCSFKVEVISPLTTQYHLAVSIYGVSSFSQMQFFLILIGNEAAGYIQALTIDQTCNLASPNPSASNVVSSANRILTTSINSTYAVNYYFSFFKLSQEQNGTTFAVWANILSIAGNSITYEYQVDMGNRLTQISLVFLVYNNVSQPLDVSTIGFSIQTGYSAVLNYADTNAPNTTTFINGYNRLCTIGVDPFVYPISSYVEFDSSQPQPPVSNMSGSYDLKIFCMTEYYNCTQIDSNCLQCISHSKCSACTSQYYVQEYPNTTAYCQLCSSAITGCLQCTNTSQCVTCVSPTYLYNSGGCTVCASFITNCKNCTNNVTCTGCVDNYGLVDPLTCTLCSTMITGCQLCTDPTNCTSCYSGYYLSGVTCLACNNGVDNCAICSSATVCLLCNSDSYLSSDNSTCICNNGKIKISGLCAPVGCSSAYRFGANTVCLACNSSLNFDYINSTSCACKTGYALTGSSCLLICGDGIVASEACDDGNVLSGDGCSSSCTVEDNYNCINGSLSSKSVCVYISDITVKLTEIRRQPGENTAVLTYSLSPNIRSLNSMNFNNYVSLAVAGHTISYSTSYAEDGTITVTAAYTSDLEGEPATFTLSYDQTKVGLSPSILNFDMVGYNQPLNTTTSTSLQNIIIYLSYGLAGLLVLQLLLSLLFHKLIGVQTMAIGQSVFFIRYLLGNNGPMPIYNMYPLSYINGYNVFASYTNVMYLDSVTMRLGLGKNFVFNVMPHLGLIFIFWLLEIYFSWKVRNMRRMGYQETAGQIEQLKKVIKVERRMSGGVFIMTVYSFFIFYFALLASIQPNDEQNHSLPRLLTALTLAVFTYGALYLTAQMYLNWQGKYDEDEGVTNKYVTIFLGYHLAMAMLVIGLYGIQYSLQVVAGIQLLYLIVVIGMRPYYIRLQNVLLVICLSIGIAFTLLLVLVKYLSISDQYISYAVVALQGLLLLACLFSIGRMCHHYSNNERAFKILHDQEDRLKGKDMFSKNEFKKRQEQLFASQVKRPTFREKMTVTKHKQKDQLAMIRSRLKEEYKRKVMQEG